jgi:CRISPR-associated protein Csb1
MPVDLMPLANATRVLFTVKLQPLQGDRFQPTGFPGLGAATYQAPSGPKLLVESVQSMANRMEAVCWDAAAQQPITPLDGISHVTVNRHGSFLTDTMIEAHRLNSPYVLESKKDRSFVKTLTNDLGGLETGPVDRQRLGETLLRYDVGSLLHGVFLAKKELAGGRLRVARAVSAFIEASGVRIAASGGVKNDHVNPSGAAKDGFGNVPFARDEFTAERIDCHVNLDLAQIRGYGLGPEVERMLVLLALHRVRRLLDGDLRLRTACDLRPAGGAAVVATRPEGFALPPLADLEADLPAAIGACRHQMVHTVVTFEDELKKGKQEKPAERGEEAGDQEPEDDGDDEV